MNWFVISFKALIFITHRWTGSRWSRICRPVRRPDTRKTGSSPPPDTPSPPPAGRGTTTRKLRLSFCPVTRRYLSPPTESSRVSTLYHRKGFYQLIDWSGFVWRLLSDIFQVKDEYVYWNYSNLMLQEISCVLLFYLWLGNYNT